MSRKKIKLSMTVTWEYEPEDGDYKEGMTIENMANLDANHPALQPLIKGEGKYSNLDWDIID